MFALRGKKLIEVVLQRIPDDIERLMQKRHTKWCNDAQIVPWSAREEIGATLRISPRFSPEDYALSWGAHLNQASVVEIYLYEGDMARNLFDAATNPLEEVRTESIRAVSILSSGGIKCKDVTDLVGKIIERIQNVVVAHKMMGVV